MSNHRCEGWIIDGRCHRCTADKVAALERELEEFKQKYHEAMDVLTEWRNIDNAVLAAQRLRERDEAHAKIAALERELADAKRLACWWCGRSPQNEPEIQLRRLNPKGQRGVFQCQHCVTELDEAHAAIRWLMARFHPYVNVPIEHAPALALASKAGIRRVEGK